MILMSGVCVLICITGDTHGDLARFKHKSIKKLKKGDFLIICGDFGFIWDGSDKEEKILKKIGKKRFTTLFIEGCHENYDLLEKYPEEDFCGGRVRVISGRLMQMKRGGIFNLQGLSFFAFGGGQSKDLDIKTDNNTWYKDELPTSQEIQQGAFNLQNIGNKIDYIITHEPPGSLKAFLDFETQEQSTMHIFFDAIKNDCVFNMWYFGKLHKNKLIPPKYTCIFDDVACIKNALPKKSKKK